MIQIPDEIVKLLQSGVIGSGSVVVARPTDSGKQPSGPPFQRFCWTKRDDERLQLAAGWAPSHEGRKCDYKDGSLVFRVDAQWVQSPSGRLICYPADPTSCKAEEWLYGRSWEEAVGEVRHFKVTKRGGKAQEVPYTASTWSGRRVMLHNGLQTGESMFIHPGVYSVWHGNRSEETGVIFEGELDEPEEDALHVPIAGELMHVADLLGFPEWDPERPPSREAIERSFDEAHLRESAGLMKVLKPLIGRDLTLEQAQLRDTVATERIEGLVQAREKLIAYSATKLVHAPAPTGRVVARKSWRDVLGELAAREAGEIKKRSAKPSRSKGKQAEGAGSQISVKVVLEAVANKHYQNRDGQRRDEFANRLNKAGYLHGAALAQADLNELAKVLKNQGRAQATIDAAKRLIDQKAQEKVKKAGAAGDVKL